MSKGSEHATVIPDIFNRESRAFPIQGHTNEGTEEKDTGFPLTTGGNDRGGPGGNDRGARASMLSFPTFLIGNPWLFPCRVTRMKGQKSKTLDSR